MNYTQVIFSATGGRKNESAPDYENVKEATDYVNINPKNHEHNLWTFVNPAVSEPVEYTQVAMWILGVCFFFGVVVFKRDKVLYEFLYLFNKM